MTPFSGQDQGSLFRCGTRTEAEEAAHLYSHILPRDRGSCLEDMQVPKWPELVLEALGECVVSSVFLAGKQGRASTPAWIGRPRDSALPLRSAVPPRAPSGRGLAGRGPARSRDGSAGRGGRGRGASDAPSGWRGSWGSRRSSAAAMGSLKDELLKGIWHAFTALDLDHSGKVSKSQLKVGTPSPGPPFAPPRRALPGWKRAGGG